MEAPAGFKKGETMSDRTEYLRRLGGLLVFHQVIQAPEELREDNFKEVVTRFQEKAGLFTDGKPGMDTLWALQQPWVEQSPKHDFVECQADVVPGYEEGLPVTHLRADAAERYQRLRAEVLSLGGHVTSDGGRRPLNAEVNANRSPTSMHYTGLAFDLFTDSGFFKPERDPFVVTRGAETYWEVWCRAEGGEDKQLEAMYWKNSSSGVDLKKTISGKFINFTELCARYGFRPIGPRTPFTRATDRKYLSAEWWHFQCGELLTPNLSQFGIELLKINHYTPAHIRAQNENIWNNRKRIYQQNWS